MDFLWRGPFAPNLNDEPLTRVGRQAIDRLVAVFPFKLSISLLLAGCQMGRYSTKNYRVICKLFETWCIKLATAPKLRNLRERTGSRHFNAH